MSNNPQLLKVGTNLMQKASLSRSKTIQQKMMQTNKLREKVERKFKEMEPVKYSMNVLKPEYKKSERLGCEVEVNAPPAEIYISLGYDREPNDKKKHYRKFLLVPLELSDFMSKKTFDTFKIVGGQSANKTEKSFLDFLMTETKVVQKSELKDVGYFKGIISIFDEE